MAYITDSWEVINKNCSEGKASELYSIGDLKTITLAWGNGTTEDIDLEIIGFSHDDLSNSEGKAQITFFSKQLLSEYRKMNTSGNNTGGWAGNYSLRSWCNGDLYNALPADLRTYIQPVKKVVGWR